MSTPQSPPPPRRRRIAGERRSARPADPGPRPVEDHREPGSSGSRVELSTAVADRDRPEPGAEAARTSPSVPPVADEAAPAAGRAPRWWGGRASLVALAAVTVLALGVLALTWFGALGTDSVADLREHEQQQTSSRAAVAAAERAAVAVLSYDHTSLDEDRDAATRFMTEEYAADYVGTFDTAVKPVAEESAARVSAEVQAAGVLTPGVDRVAVLLFVDQTTTSTNFDRPQQALNRVELDMVRQDGSWLIADIASF